MYVLPCVNPKLTLELVNSFSRTHILDDLANGLSSAFECLTIPVPILPHPRSLQCLQHLSTAMFIILLNPVTNNFNGC